MIHCLLEQTNEKRILKAVEGTNISKKKKRKCRNFLWIITLRILVWLVTNAKNTAENLHWSHTKNTTPWSKAAIDLFVSTPKGGAYSRSFFLLPQETAPRWDHAQAFVPIGLVCWLLRADTGSHLEAHTMPEVFSKVFASGLGVLAEQDSSQSPRGTFSTDPAKPGLSPGELDSL